MTRVEEQITQYLYQGESIREAFDVGPVGIVLTSHRVFASDPDEVAGVLWAPYERLARNRRWYRQLQLCPWFEIAMRRDLL